MKKSKLKLVVITLKKELNFIAESNLSFLSRISMDSTTQIIISVPVIKNTGEKTGHIKLA